VWETRLPVIRIALQLDVRTTFPFLELEWARTDRCLIGGIGLEVGPGIQMLGQDRDRTGLESVNERRKRRFQLELNRGFVKRRNRVDILAYKRSDTRLGLAQEFIDGKNNVSRREWLAIMPLDPFLQLEGVDQTVVGNSP